MRQEKPCGEVRGSQAKLDAATAVAAGAPAAAKALVAEGRQARFPPSAYRGRAVGVVTRCARPVVITIAARYSDEVLTGGPARRWSAGRT